MPRHQLPIFGIPWGWNTPVETTKEQQACTAIEAVREQVIEHGLEGIAAASARTFEKVMRI
jgi:hypothetical protein